MPPNIGSFEVAKFLVDTNDPILLKKVDDLASQLIVPLANYQQLKLGLYLGFITYQHIFHHILNYWITQNSRDATISNLSCALKSPALKLVYISGR